jgi:hypothetical protein
MSLTIVDPSALAFDDAPPRFAARRLRTLAFIEEYRRVTGRGPTVRQLVESGTCETIEAARWDVRCLCQSDRCDRPAGDDEAIGNIT